MKKIFIGFFSLIIICILLFFAIARSYNINNLLTNIKKNTGLEIELKDENVWSFYPLISFSNSKVSIRHKKNHLYIDEGVLNINKKYSFTSPISISLKAPIINYSGIELRDTDILLKYQNNIVTIENFLSKIIEGNIDVKGKIHIDNNQSYSLQGKFNNISLNTLLRQTKIATWDRVDVKLSSADFILSGIGANNLINSLNGEIPIKGSLYFVISDEERFGAAFLSLLAEKIPSLSSISKSVDILLLNFANSPSSLKGIIKLEEGILSSSEILVFNNSSKLSFNGTYNLLNDTIDGTIYFYEKNNNIIEASIKGNINDPQILVGGKVLSNKKNLDTHQDIKKLLTEGLSSFIDKLLSNYE